MSPEAKATSAPAPERRITVTRLACRRGERRLVEALSFDVEPGRAVLLRGANGAGKTTLLLTLAGELAPAEGRIEIAGRHPEDRPGTDIGFLGHLSAVKPRLTLLENLEFWAALYGVPRAAVLPALETVGLAAIGTLEAGHLSAGQTRRLALARLVLCDRPIWLMDEPTAALDANGEALVAELVDAHLDRGGLVVAATHHDLGLRDPDRTRTVIVGAP